jgi:hypothetical protein
MAVKIGGELEKITGILPLMAVEIGGKFEKITGILPLVTA